jgi:hypothetical protein
LTRPISATAIAVIEAAMAQLLADPIASKDLTVARLAAEAGLSRATLYRAPELLARFRQAASVRPEAASVTTPVDRAHQLEAEIASLRGRETDELRTLRTANRHMAQRIQALSLLVGEQERKIAQLQAVPSLPGSARVVPFAAPGDPASR